MGPLSEGLAVDPESAAAGLNLHNQRTAMSPDLALSLPASRNFQPVDLALIRESMFPPQKGGFTFEGFSREALPHRSRNRRKIAEGLYQPPRKDSLRAKVETGELPVKAARNLIQALQDKSEGYQQSKLLPDVGPKMTASVADPGSETFWASPSHPLQPPADLTFTSKDSLCLPLICQAAMYLKECPACQTLKSHSFNPFVDTCNAFRQGLNI